jgi:Arc/MetJ family transcription regulator
MAKSRSASKSAGVAVKSGVRTNVVLDEKLVTRVKRLSRAKTTREAIQLALEHYARSRDYSKVLALYGTGGVAEDYDPKNANPA